MVSLGTPKLIGNQVIIGFDLMVAPGITYYLDPKVATGYIYQTGAGNPNFASVELPNIGNPNPYELYSWDGTSFVFDTMLAAGTLHDFVGDGVSKFEVLGIDPSLDLDPTNSTAFITALTFEDDGSFTGTMTPITTPEPASLTLLTAGLLGFGLIRRRRTPRDDADSDDRCNRWVCFHGGCEPRRDADVTNSSAQTTVVPATPAVPEPGALPLMAAAIGLWFAFRLRLQRR
jgi:hypothetical protein